MNDILISNLITRILFLSLEQTFHTKWIKFSKIYIETFFFENQKSYNLSEADHFAKNEVNRNTNWNENGWYA